MHQRNLALEYGSTECAAAVLTSSTGQSVKHELSNGEEVQILFLDTEGFGAQVCDLAAVCHSYENHLTRLIAVGNFAIGCADILAGDTPVLGVGIQQVSIRGPFCGPSDLSITVVLEPSTKRRLQTCRLYRL